MLSNINRQINFQILFNILFWSYHGIGDELETNHEGFLILIAPDNFIKFTRNVINL